MLFTFVEHLEFCAKSLVGICFFLGSLLLLKSASENLLIVELAPSTEEEESNTGLNVIYQTLKNVRL